MKCLKKKGNHMKCSREKGVKGKKKKNQNKGKEEQTVIDVVASPNISKVLLDFL